MKFVLLLFDPENYWESVTKQEMAAALEEHGAFAEFLKVHGGEFSGEAVQPARAARTLRPSEGGVLVRNGALVELKEDIAGFYVIECANMDEAVDIAKRCPIGAGIEIRPVWGGPTDDTG